MSVLSSNSEGCHEIKETSQCMFTFITRSSRPTRSGMNSLVFTWEQIFLVLTHTDDIAWYVNSNSNISNIVVLEYLFFVH